MAASTPLPACFTRQLWSRNSPHSQLIGRPRSLAARVTAGLSAVGESDPLRRPRKDPRRRLVLGQRRGAGDQGLELVEGQVGDGLEDLLVGPADLPRFLMEVVGRVAVRLQGLLEVG